MTFDYSRPRATAERLLERFGFEVILEKPGEDGGDPWNPGPGEPTQHPITVVQQFERLRDRDGTLIGQTVLTLLVSTAGGIIPAKSDRVQIKGVWREVLEVRPISPGGVDLMFELDCVA